MQTASGPFAIAVISPSQIVAYQVFISFPNTVNTAFQNVTTTVRDIAINRSITTNLPDGTTQLSGYPTASATINLSGPLDQGFGNLINPTQTIYWLMNPNDPSSPMWRTTRAGLVITISAGLYDGSNVPELVTVFTGSIDTSACSYGLVTLTCRDNRTNVTNQGLLPPVITQTPYNAGLTSEFAMDWLLRNSSPSRYYTWPDIRSNCLLAVGFRSSIWPQVGSYATYAQTPNFQVGMYGTALAHSGVLVVYDLVEPLLTTDKYCAQFLSVDTGLNLLINDNAVTYQVLCQRSSLNNLLIYTQTPSGRSVNVFDLALSPGGHLIEFSLGWAASSTTLSGTVWIDGTPTALSVTTADARPTNMNFTLAAVDGPIEGVQITNESAYTPLGIFTPTFILDDSLNPLIALPDITGQDTWGILQDIASAEFGVIGFDELGLVHFTNRYSIATTASVATVSSNQTLISLDTQEQMSMVATHIQQPVNQIMIQDFQIVWSASTAVQIPAGQTFQTSAITANPIVSLGTSIEIIPNGGVLATGFSGYRAAKNANGSGGAITNLSMTVAQLSPTVVTIAVKNPNGFPVYLVSPSGAGYPSSSVGLPALVIGALPIFATGIATDVTTVVAGGAVADAQWPPVTDGGAIANQQFGEILLALPANNWLQDFTTADTLVEDLLSDYYQPRPLYRNVSIIADPRLQLLDRITLVDPVVSSTSTDVLLMGINLQIGQGRWIQNIDALALYAPGDWILDDSVYSILDSTTYI